MPNNPLTQQELYDYGILRILTPPTPAGTVPSAPYFPPGYFLVPPHDVDGIVAWRKFHAGYITEGLIDPDRLGTGSLGFGDLYLADDGTWKIVSGLLPPGGTTGQILAKIDGVDYNTEWIDNYTSSVKHEVKLGENMSKGTPVYVSGTTGGSGTNMIVSKASNATEMTSSKTMGLIATGGVTNDFVFVVTEGLLAGLDTSTAIAGDPVWLGPNGTLLFGLANKPVAPAHMVALGVVTRVSTNNGEIFVKVQNGFEIEELHDVLITSKANNDLLVYESATSLWKNKTISSIFGGTPLVTTPTLAQVTTAGNTTTNSITVGGLTVDTNLIYTDTVNNRVGINTTTPTERLEVGSSSIYNTKIKIVSDGFSTTTGLEIVRGSSVWNIVNSGSLSIVRGGVSVLTASASLNVLIGTTTDAGFKLDVNGTGRASSLMVGTQSTIATNIKLEVDGKARIWNDLELGQFGVTKIKARTLEYLANGSDGFLFKNLLSHTATISTYYALGLENNINPSSGNAVFNLLQIKSTINQTGGANGITRGLYINPTLTSAADFRAIETSAGKVIHQGLTAATQTDQIYYNTTTGELTYGALPTVATPTLDQVTTAGNTTTNSITVDKLTVSTGTSKGIEFGGTKVVEAANLSSYTQLLTQPISGNKTAVLMVAPSGTEATSVLELYHSSSLSSNQRVAFKNVNGLLQLGGDVASFPIEFIGSNNAWMKIFATGNVAINSTTDAGYKLDVNGSIRGKDNLYITSFSENDGIFADDAFGSTMFSISRRSSNEIRFHSYGFTTFYTSGNTGTEKMRITEAGNVGIGTLSPTDTNSYGKALDIQSNAGAAAYFRDSDDTSKYFLSGFAGQTTNHGIIGTWGTDTLLRVFTSGNERMRIDSFGNVGIGTTAPGYKLEVAGTFRSSGAAYASGGLGVNLTGGLTSDFDVNGFAKVRLDLQVDRRIYVNDFLYIGTSTFSGYKLDVNGTARISGNTTVVGQVTATNGSDTTNLTSAGINMNRFYCYIVPLSNNSQTLFFGDVTKGVQDWAAISLKATNVELAANVGINTASPTVPLDVNGAARIQGNMNAQTYSVNGTAGWTGTITIPTNPPGQQNIAVNSGIITNVF